MARNIQALEHRGRIYISLDDLQGFMQSLAEQSDHPIAKNALFAVLYKLAEVRGKRPNSEAPQAPRNVVP